ncbi:MAG: hypothetical protein WC635_01550 [Bacteriovorax sp.]|jgi:hypothetical protein
MRILTLISLIILSSCNHNKKINAENRIGNKLGPELYQDTKIYPESSPLHPAKRGPLPPITYNSYSDSVEAGETVKYFIYGNSCISGVSYGSLNESKHKLKDASDNFKWKSYSFYEFSIHHDLIDEKNEDCERIYKEDQIIYTLEIPVGKEKSFVKIFASPDMEVRRNK